MSRRIECSMCLPCKCVENMQFARSHSHAHTNIYIYIDQKLGTHTHTQRERHPSTISMNENLLKYNKYSTFFRFISPMIISMMNKQMFEWIRLACNHHLNREHPVSDKIHAHERVHVFVFVSFVSFCIPFQKKACIFTIHCANTLIQ